MFCDATRAKAFIFLLCAPAGCSEATSGSASALPDTCSTNTNLEANGIRISPQRANTRPVAVACDRDRPCPAIEEPRGCSSHLECDDGVNGRCMPSGVACSYDECFVDEDCSPLEVCDCAGGFNGNHICARAECRVNADCGEGLACSPSSHPFCQQIRPVEGYFCHRPNDTCRVDLECAEGEWCAFHAEEDLWRCTAGDDQRCIR